MKCPSADALFVRTAVEIAKELDGIIAKARPVPLTDQVRVEKDKVTALLSELRQSLEAGRIA
jgi:hypothetical protein